MAKQIIRLTESELMNVVKNATRKALIEIQMITEKGLQTVLLENRNFERAKKAVANYCKPHDSEEVFKIIHDIQRNIPYSRIYKDKYLAGVIRLVYNEGLDDSYQETINDILSLIDGNAIFASQYNGDFNGLYFEELYFRFYNELQGLLEKERNNSEAQEYKPNDSYSIIEIKNFSDANRFSNYVDWCITNSEFDFHTYTPHGETFYFCLKDGYENTPRIEGEKHPLDDYGLSMIAVSVRKNGRLASSTTRWNESSRGGRILNPQQIGLLIGRNFYSVFKPNNCQSNQ